MANRVELKDVTVPPGTLQAAPAQTDVSFPPGVVTRLEVVIPDGAAGLVGWQLAQAHSPVVPRTSGAFVKGNDEVVKWPADGYLNNGNWQVFAYNTDVNPHTLQFRFLVNELTTPSPAAGEPAALSVIGSDGLPLDLTGADVTGGIPDLTGDLGVDLTPPTDTGLPGDLGTGTITTPTDGLGTPTTGPDLTDTGGVDQTGTGTITFTDGADLALPPDDTSGASDGSFTLDTGTVPDTTADTGTTATTPADPNGKRTAKPATHLRPHAKRTVTPPKAKKPAHAPTRQHLPRPAAHAPAQKPAGVPVTRHEAPKRAVVPDRPHENRPATVKRVVVASPGAAPPHSAPTHAAGAQSPSHPTAAKRVPAPAPPPPPKRAPAPPAPEVRRTPAPVAHHKGK